MFVSPCFVRSVTTFNANVKEFRSITVLLKNRQMSIINPEINVYYFIYSFFIWSFRPFQNYITSVEPIEKQR